VLGIVVKSNTLVLEAVNQSSDFFEKRFLYKRKPLLNKMKFYKSIKVAVFSFSGMKFFLFVFESFFDFLEKK